MSEKIFKIVNGDLSDGYHTFDELYDHRCLLWIALVKYAGVPEKSYCVQDHLDGWDLLVAETLAGQISYHVPIKFRQYMRNIDVVSKEIYEEQKKYDGHTGTDVLKRLKILLTPEAFEQTELLPGQDRGEPNG
jgi:hypothetical protein